MATAGSRGQRVGVVVLTVLSLGCLVGMPVAAAAAGAPPSAIIRLAVPLAIVVVLTLMVLRFEGSTKYRRWGMGRRIARATPFEEVIITAAAPRVVGSDDIPTDLLNPDGEPELPDWASEAEFTAVGLTTIDGETVVAAGTAQGIVVIKNLSSGGTRVAVVPDSEEIESVWIIRRPSGPAALCVTEAQELWWIDLGSGAVTECTLDGSSDEFDPELMLVTTVADRPLLVAAGEPGTLLVWDLATSSLVGTPRKLSRSRITALAAANLAGHQVAICGFANGRVQVHDLATGSTVGRPWVGAPAEVATLAVGPVRGETVVFAVFAGLLQIRSLATGALLAELVHDSTSAMLVDPDYRLLLSVCAEDLVVRALPRLDGMEQYVGRYYQFDADVRAIAVDRYGPLVVACQDGVFVLERGGL